MRKATYILTADWHLREDTPVCRTDDFESEQWKKVAFISALQQQHNCPVLHGGDLYEHWKPTPSLLSKTIEHLPKQFYSVYGNHDLPQHNMDLAHKCGVFTLKKAGVLSTESPVNTIVEFCHWGKIPFAAEPDGHLLYHVFNYQGKSPWPGCTSPTAKELLKKYPAYDLIVTGDNHKTFVEQDAGRILVNPGSLTRQKADQINHKPCVFLYYEKDNTVEQVFLPISLGVISREHLDKTTERDNRLEAFVSKLNSDWQAEMSFEDNLEAFYQKNNTREPIKNLINKAIE